MPLNLEISTLVMPNGTEFPGTPDELKDLLVQYMEITGGESFDGINTGSSTPAAADRDKPWDRKSIADEKLGWHYWDGSDWVKFPVIVDSLTTVEREAISSPQDGRVVWDSNIKKLFVSDPSTGFEPCVPVDTRVHYDLSHTYPQHQLLVSTGALQTAWTEIDLTSYVNALGLDAVNGDGDKKYTIKAAKIRVMAQHGPSGIGTATKWTSTRVASDSVYSTTANDVLHCYSLHTYDDSAASSSNQISGDVPPKTDSYSIYWNYQGDPGNNYTTQIYLTGFIYTTTDAYFS